MLKGLRILNGVSLVLCVAGAAASFGTGFVALGVFNLVAAALCAYHIRNLTIAMRMEEAEAEWKSDFTRAIEEAEREADAAKVTPFRKKGE